MRQPVVGQVSAKAWTAWCVLRDADMPLSIPEVTRRANRKASEDAGRWRQVATLAEIGVAVQELERLGFVRKIGLTWEAKR